MAILGLPPPQQPAYPSHFDIERVIRPNILSLHPYRCARDDYDEGILLDANENALGHSLPAPQELDPVYAMNLHRYPDPAQLEIKSRIASLRRIPDPSYVFLGVGSDEVIDLLMRVCVAPAREKILITPPTYGMYSVCAQVNDVGVVKVLLETEGGAFSLKVDEVRTAVKNDPNIKLIFLCSPGNPTSTLLSLDSIRAILEEPVFNGIVIVDEAYIDFAGDDASAVNLVKQYSNICVLQTLSKSFGLAAIRLGVAIAQPPLIQVLTNTKAPYNISTPTAHLALAALSAPSIAKMKTNVRTLQASREALLSSFASLASSLALGTPLGGNNANFILLPVLNRETGRPDSARALRAYTTMAETKGVVVRFRGKEVGCEGCLRVTVGSEEENAVLLKTLQEVLTTL